MALVRGHIPNLVQGISQQVQELRLNSQLEECENMLPSVSRGLVRRPPLEFIDTLDGANMSSDSAWHNIDRDMNEQYVLVVGQDESIQVFDLEGNSQTVSTTVPESTQFNTKVRLFNKGAGGTLGASYNTFVDYGDIAERQKSGTDIVFTVVLGQWSTMSVESASDAEGADRTIILDAVTESGDHTVTADLSGNFIRVSGTDTTVRFDRTILDATRESGIGSGPPLDTGWVYYAGYGDRHVSGSTIRTTVVQTQVSFTTVRDGGVGGSGARTLRSGSSIGGVSTTTVDPNGSYIRATANYSGNDQEKSINIKVRATEYKTGIVSVYMVFTEEESEAVNLGYLSMPEGVSAKDAFEFLTIADYTFILNKTVIVEAATGLTARRDQEVLAFVKEAVLDSDLSITFNLQDVDSSEKITTNYNFPKTTGDGPVLTTTEDAAFHLAWTFDNAKSGGQEPSGSRDAQYVVSSSDAVTGYNSALSGTGERGFNNKSVTLAGGGTGTRTFNGWESNARITYPTTPHNVIGKISADQVNASVLYEVSTPLDSDESWSIDSFSDSRSGGQLIIIEDSVRRFSDLPDQAWDGIVVRVSGDEGSDLDDYYVKFAAADTATNKGRGLWLESAAPGISTGLNPRTMPHALVRTEDGTFEIGPIDWADRDAGDDRSNPHPSFVGSTINNLSFFKSRLLMLANDNVVMSEVGEFFNFYRTSVLSVLDGDPIDIQAADVKVANITHAVPYNNTLIAFADRGQYEINSGEGSLTPATVSITPSTAYETSDDVTPISLGSSIFFPVNRGNYSGIREYFVAPDQNGLSEAIDITAHCPRYLPPNLRQIVGNTQEDIIAVLPDSPNSRYIYVYNYFWRGDEKVQDAWTRWDIGGTNRIMHIFFLNDKLYIIYSYPSSIGERSIAIGSINVADGYLEDAVGEPIVHLDFRATEEQVEMDYTPSLNLTRVYADLPLIGDPDDFYVDGSTFFIVGRGRDFGRVPLNYTVQNNDSGGNVLFSIADEDWRNVNFYVGIKNKSIVTLSNQYVREPPDNLVIKAYSLLMKFFTIGYANTDSFDVRVLHRQTDASEFATLRNSTVQDGDFKFSIIGRTRNIDIQFTSNDWKPFTLVNAQWEADFKLFSTST